MGPSELDRVPISRPAETAAAGGRRQGGRIHGPGSKPGQVLSELSGRFHTLIHSLSCGFTSATHARILRSAPETSLASAMRELDHPHPTLAPADHDRKREAGWGNPARPGAKPVAKPAKDAGHLGHRGETKNPMRKTRGEARDGRRASGPPTCDLDTQSCGAVDEPNP